MELLLTLAVAMAVFYLSWWRHPALPLLGCAAAVGYGVWRGGIGGVVFAGLAILINLSFWVGAAWWGRRIRLPQDGSVLP